MALGKADYYALLQAALPQGPAWPKEDDAIISKQLSVWAEEFARVDARIEDLINDADPRTTSELLLSYERVAGLPDECVTTSQSHQQRISALVTKLQTLGGQSRQYFIDMAADLDYPDATIDEFYPMRCDDPCDSVLNSVADRYWWRINLPSDGATYVMKCDDPCDSPLQSWGEEVIECRIEQYKPAHTNVIFAYV